MKRDGIFMKRDIEKTIFMTRDGKELIMHGIFVDDMKHVPTANIFLMSFWRSLIFFLEDIALWRISLGQL